jgi:hypothetical protein
MVFDPDFTLPVNPLLSGLVYFSGTIVLASAAIGWPPFIGSPIVAC